VESWFKKFDTNNDGVVDINEFKVGMKNMMKEFMPKKPALTDEEADAAFKLWDKDGSGEIDLPEFKQAFATIKNYKEDTNGTAALAKQVDQLLGLATAVVPGVGKATETAQMVADNVDIKSKPPPDTQDTQPLIAKPDPDQAQSDVKCYLYTVVFLLFFLVVFLFLVLCGPAIVFWIGVASGESCNEPLMTWTIGMAVLSTYNAIPFMIVAPVFCTIACAMMSGNESKMAELGDQDAMQEKFSSGPMAAQTGALTSCAQCFGFVWFIYGCVVFDAAGGFGDASTDCTRNAPLLFDIAYYYYLISIIFVCVLPICICCICLPLVAMGGNTTAGAMKDARY
jgi:hypothetical protein